MNWLRTPPNKNDLFGVHIREAYQQFERFTCHHKEWVNKDVWVHGENHGPDRYNRYCKRCGQKQTFVYYKIGPIRWGWKDDVDFDLIDFEWVWRLWPVALIVIGVNWG